MKYSIFLFLISLSILVGAQDDKNTSNKISLEFEPVLSTIGAKNGFNYQYSVLLEHNLSEKFSYSLGIGVANLGLQENIVLDTFSIKVTLGELESFAYRKATFQYKYFYIPLNLIYHHRKFQMEVGIHPYLFQDNEHIVSDEIEIYFVEHSTYRKSEINKLNFAFNLGLSYNMKINKNWDAFIKTSGQVFLIPMYKQEQIEKVKQFNLGFSFGIKRLLYLPKKKK